MSIVAEYRLPALSVPFPPPAASEHGDELRAETCAWAERHGLIGIRGRERLLGSSLLDLGVSLTSGAEPARAEVMMAWFLWMLLLDDRVDNGPWAEAGALSGFARSVAAITADQSDDHPVDRAGRTPTAEPMLAVLTEDLWRRTTSLGPAVWRHRFAGHLAAHLRAQHTVVGVRAETATEPLTVADYAPLRRDLFGADLFFDLMEAMDGPPESAPTSERDTLLRAHAADAISWTNDVFSVEKDLAFGEKANLVLLLHGENGGSWQDAIDSAHRMIDDRVQRFIGIRADDGLRLRAADPFASRLEEAIRASLDWHRSSSRYRHQAPAPSDEANVSSRSEGPALISSSRTSPSLLWPEFERDPYPLYDRLRTEFPITFDEPLDAWLLSRYVDVHAALADPRFTSENYRWQLAPMFGPTVMQMDGSEHAAHRAFLTPAFRGNALKVLRVVIRRSAENLVRHLSNTISQDSPVDLVTGFTHQLPISVVVSALGLPCEDVPLFQRWYKAGFSYLGNYRQDPAMLAAGLSSRDELYAYLDPHLARRRAHPSDDLLSIMCTVEVDGQRLPDSVIKGFCGAVLGAGGETTDKALSSYLATLIDNPDALVTVRDDPAASPGAWAESLRLNPPVHVILRQTSESIDLPSGRVPGGATIACLIASANRDPSRFTEPDTFDVHRTDGRQAREFTAAASHVAFGGGRHFCLGAHLAMAEAEIGVSTLLNTLPDLAWAPGFHPTPTGLLTRAPATLMVTHGPVT